MFSSVFALDMSPKTGVFSKQAMLVRSGEKYFRVFMWSLARDAIVVSIENCFLSSTKG